MHTSVYVRMTLLENEDVYIIFFLSNALFVELTMPWNTA